MEKWKQETGADLVRVPFKGGGDTVTGMLSGTTPVGFLGLGNLLSYVRAGSITPILSDGEKRSPLIPDVPAFGEIGMAREHTRAFFGLLAPANTPRPIIDKLRAEIVRIVNEPEFHEQESDRARSRAGAQHAGGIPRLPDRRPRARRTHRQGEAGTIAVHRRWGTIDENFDAVVMGPRLRGAIARRC